MAIYQPGRCAGGSLEDFTPPWLTQGMRPLQALLHIRKEELDSTTVRWFRDGQRLVRLIIDLADAQVNPNDLDLAATDLNGILFCLGNMRLYCV